jgi:hypothetical protein
VIGTLRSVIAAAGVLVVGALAGTAVATAAHAATEVKAEIQTDAICDTAKGEWIVVWKVLNNDGTKDATLANVAPAVSGLVDAVIPKAGSVIGYQRLATGVKTATLSLKISWPPSADQSPLSKYWSGGDCTMNPADCVTLTASTAGQYFKHTFNGTAGTAKIWRGGTTPIKPLCSPVTLTLVSYYAPAPTFDLPQYVFDYDTQQFGGTTYELNFKIDLPPCFTQVDFVFGERIDPLTSTSGLYNDRKVGSGSGWGHLSNGPSAWFNGSGTQTQTCTQPAATATSSCDGSGTLHLNNDGAYSTVFKVTKNGGPETAVTVAAHAGADPALPFLTVAPGEWPVHVTGDHSYDTTLTWSWPADCPPPTLTADPNCDKVVLTVSNPAGNKPLATTVAYGGQPAQTGTVTGGGSKAFTFNLTNADTATISFADRPAWTLTAAYDKAASCELADTGSNLTGVIATGTGLVVVGAGLMFLVTRRILRRRRVA